MDVWTYWEGDIPPLVQRCLDRTATMYGDRFHLLRKWPQDWLGSAPDCAPNYRACLVRYELLARYGGHYLDADCIVFRDLDLLHGDRELTTIRDRGHYCDNNYLGVSSPQHPIVEFWRDTAWMKYQRGLLDRYTALGKHIITACPGRPLKDNRCIMPIHWTENHRFAAARTPEEHQIRFNPDAYCYMLTRGIVDRPMPANAFIYWLLEQPTRAD